MRSLNARQLKYARLVADGMSEQKAVLEANYSLKSRQGTLRNLRNNRSVVDQIEYFKSNNDDEEVADLHARERFWTTMMNNPACNDAVRLKASEHLGKSQGDFINTSKVEHSTKEKPIILIPNNSPKEWEEYWESKNE